MANVFCNKRLIMIMTPFFTIVNKYQYRFVIAHLVLPLDFLWLSTNAFENLPKYVRVLLKRYCKNSAFLIHRIIELFTREVCIFLKKKNSLFLNAGIEIRTGDRWKTVTIEKELVRKLFFIWKKLRWKWGHHERKIFT